MREYLFRGKRLDNGEWVESGCIFKLINKSGDHSFISQLGEKLIATHDDNMMNIVALENMTMYRVDPETVGQYTGLRDCKRTAEYPEGQMIFEGDIVEVADKCSNNIIYSIEYKWGAFMLKQKGVNYHIYFRDLPIKYYTMEVIGNIHDNKEILDAE